MHYGIAVKRDSLNKKKVLVNYHYSLICLSSFSEIGFLRPKIKRRPCQNLLMARYFPRP